MRGMSQRFLQSVRADGLGSLVGSDPSIYKTKARLVHGHDCCTPCFDAAPKHVRDRVKAEYEENQARLQALKDRL